MGDSLGYTGTGLDDAYSGDALVRAFSPHILAHDWSRTALRTAFSARSRRLPGEAARCTAQSLQAFSIAAGESPRVSRATEA